MSGTVKSSKSHHQIETTKSRHNLRHYCASLSRPRTDSTVPSAQATNPHGSARNFSQLRGRSISMNFEISKIKSCCSTSQHGNEPRRSPRSPLVLFSKGRISIPSRHFPGTNKKIGTAVTYQWPKGTKAWKNAVDHVFRLANHRSRLFV